MSDPAHKTDGLQPRRDAGFAPSHGSATILGDVPVKKGVKYEEKLSSHEQTEVMKMAGDVSSLTLNNATKAAPEASSPNDPSSATTAEDDVERKGCDE